MTEQRCFGPMPADAPAIAMQEKCPACKIAFNEGDYTALVEIGPGDNPNEQQRAREGRVYNAVAIQAHYLCVTGRKYP